MQIEVIKPRLSKTRGVHAFFTLKNEAFSPDSHSIKGLNLGYNTTEAPEIITQNRELLLKETGIDPNRIAFANQVHSNRVKVVTEAGTYAETDGLITQIPQLALAIQVADCAAILLYDENSRTIAAVHAGWRGAAGDIVPRTINKMKQMGSKPQNCRAFISPCISQQNFEVGEEVAEQFPDQFVDYASYKKPHLNLKRFLLHQLTEAGLKNKNIEMHSGCTVREAGSFYSYRREKENSGRMMGVIQLKQEAD